MESEQNGNGQLKVVAQVLVTLDDRGGVSAQFMGDLIIMLGLLRMGETMAIAQSKKQSPIVVAPAGSVPPLKIVP